MSISLDPSTGLSQFFEGIWGTSVDGYVYLPTKDQANVWKKTFYKWPEHKKHVISHVLANTSSGKDVYYSPAIWEKPVIDDSNAHANIKGSFVVWADFDGNSPEDWLSDAADGAHGAAPGEPSIIVQSSTDTHQHVYWRLNEFQSDLNFIENTNRAIAYSYRADTSGWDVKQVLRPPFTTNYKHDLPVIVASFSATDYSINAFSSIKPVKQLVNHSVDETSLPDALQIIGKYTWDSDTLDLLNKDVPDGSRSSALMRVGYKCAELGLSETEAYSVLLYLDDRLGKFKNRNDRKRRLLDIVNKAMQKYPHKLEEPTFAGLTGDRVIPTEDTQYVFGFKDFLLGDYSVDWAIKDVMPLDGCGLIVSAPNVGKTQILTHLAINQALGTNFLSFEFDRARKGIMFSLEMGKPGFFRMAVDLVKEYMGAIEVLQTNFIIIPLGEPMPLITVAKANIFFEALIEEHQPEWIAIDSLQKVITGKLSDDEVIRGFFNYLAGIRQRSGIYIWLIHHQRKAQGDNKKPKELSDVYGSMYITAEPDVVLSLWPLVDKGKGIIELSQLKNRYSECADPIIMRRVKNLNYIPYVEDTMQGMVDSATPLGIVPPDSSGEDRETPKFRFDLS